MSKTGAWFVIGTVTLLGLIMDAFGVWYHNVTSCINQVNSQLQQLIAIHDKNTIQQVSLDEPTAKFLEDLPAGTKVTQTSGNQGGRLTADGFVTIYNVSEIGKQSVDVYMKERNSFFEYFMPRSKLYGVSIQSKRIGL